MSWSLKSNEECKRKAAYCTERADAIGVEKECVQPRTFTGTRQQRAAGESDDHGLITGWKYSFMTNFRPGLDK
jgi:hypothetical protein